MRTALLILLGILTSAGLSAMTSADDVVEDAPRESRSKQSPSASQVSGAVPLNPQQTVLLDAERKRLLLKTTIVQREALLEMFLCKAGTKEHEAVVSIDADAYVVHAGLLAIGAKPGQPVQYQPQYRPPTGQVIEIFVNWVDEKNRPHRQKAQEWVRHVTRRYYVTDLKALPEGFTLPEETELRHDPKRGELIWFGPMSETERDRHLKLSADKDYQQAIRQFFADSQSKEMDADFVFAGSTFVTDEKGKRFYLAETGNIICVANFTEATIDVATRSTAENSDLMFEPYAERIPPIGTEVTVELVPRKEGHPPESDSAEDAENATPGSPKAD